MKDFSSVKRMLAKRSILEYCTHLRRFACAEAVRAQRSDERRVLSCKIHGQELRVMQHRLHRRPWRAQELAQHTAQHSNAIKLS